MRVFQCEFLVWGRTSGLDDVGRIEDKSVFMSEKLSRGEEQSKSKASWCSKSSMDSGVGQSQG